jgi:hypothetical protein
MEYRALPGQLRHQPGIGGAEADVDFMLVANQHFAGGIGFPETAASETENVEIRGRAVGRELEDRAVSGELLEGLEVASESADARGFAHRHLRDTAICAIHTSYGRLEACPTSQRRFPDRRSGGGRR